MQVDLSKLTDSSLLKGLRLAILVIDWMKDGVIANRADNSALKFSRHLSYLVMF